MDCAYNAEDGESLPILQVHSWGQVPLNLSEFKEASISPTRDLLLLLSYQCEALLLPLARNDLPEQSSSLASLSLPVSPSQPASPNHSSFFQLPVMSPSISSPSKSVEPKFYTPPTSQSRTFCSPKSISKHTSKVAQTPELTPFCTPSWSPFRDCSSIYDTPTNAPYETPERLPSCVKYPIGVRKDSSCSTSSVFPYISDVRSMAWGCCGDESGSTKHGLPFKELLFVSGNGSLTVHAFCSKELENGMTSAGANTTSEEVGQEPLEGREGAGRSVSWGPIGVSLEDCSASEVQVAEESNDDSLSPGRFQEVVNLTGGLGERGDKSSGGGVDGKDSIGCSTSKKWLQSFLMDIDMEESGGNLLAKFPPKATFPSSAEVVSFCISCSSPTFMHFVCSTGETDSFANQESGAASKSMEEEKGGKVVNQVLDADSVHQHHFHSESSKKFSLPEQFEQDRGYKCSKLFSSPSHRLVGMVLTRQKIISEAVEEGHPKSAYELFVLVAMVHKWGIRWVCSVDLQNSAWSPMLEDCWSAFQLADEVLLGLKESGVIFMWTATTGKFMACLDVLRHCRLELNLQCHKEGESKPQNFLYKDKIESSMIRTAENESAYEWGGKFQKMRMSGKVRPAYCFTKLLVTANCLLIAVTDKHGSVYTISVDEYFADLKLLPESSISLPKSFNCCDLNVLSSWEVAGFDIGSQKSHSAIPNRHWLKSFSDTRGEVAGSSQTEEVPLRSIEELMIKTGETWILTSSLEGMVTWRRKVDF